MGEVGDSLTSGEVCERAERHSWKLQGGVPALGRSLEILYSMHVDIEGLACVTFSLPPTDPCRGKLTMQHTPLSCKHPRKQALGLRSEHRTLRLILSLVF